MQPKLTRREQQAMDVVYRDSPCTVQDLQTQLDVSYSAARAVLSRLVEKSVLRFEQDGPRYVYLPASDLRQTRSSALGELVSTLFKGSTADAMGALLAMSGDAIGDEELAEIETKVRRAREARGQSGRSA